MSRNAFDDGAVDAVVGHLLPFDFVVVAEVVGAVGLLAKAGKLERTPRDFETLVSSG